MQKSMRFGFCGLAACMCSFCLSTAPASPQDAKLSESAKPVATRDSPEAQPVAPSLLDLQQQNLAVLQALEQLREDRETAFTRYTQSITAELNLLKEAFTTQRAQELQSAQSANRFILSMAAALAGLAVLIMLLSAILPVLAMKRFAAAGRLQPLKSLLLEGRLGAPGLPVLDPAAPDASGSGLGKAIEQFERRLLELEQRTSQSQQLVPRKADPPAKSAPSPAKSEPASAKAANAAHVALTLQGGQAIGFLPREISLERFHFFRAALGKFKRVFRRT